MPCTDIDDLFQKIESDLPELFDEPLSQEDCQLVRDYPLQEKSSPSFELPLQEMKQEIMELSSLLIDMDKLVIRFDNLLGTANQKCASVNGNKNTLKVADNQLNILADNLKLLQLIYTEKLRIAECRQMADQIQKNCLAENIKIGYDSAKEWKEFLKSTSLLLKESAQSHEDLARCPGQPNPDAPTLESGYNAILQ